MMVALLYLHTTRAGGSDEEGHDRVMESPASRTKETGGGAVILGGTARSIIAWIISLSGHSYIVRLMILMSY